MYKVLAIFFKVTNLFKRKLFKEIFKELYWNKNFIIIKVYFCIINYKRINNAEPDVTFFAFKSRYLIYYFFCFSNADVARARFFKHRFN